MSKIKDFFYDRENQYKVDIIKDVLSWIVITALAFVYWMAVLLILSLILLSVWHVKIEQIIAYSLILTVISSAAYLIWIFKRRGKEKAKAKAAMNR